MKLEGSCHCRAVTFTVESTTFHPFMHCHCSICRKTAGSGGYGINLGGDATTLKVKGGQHLGLYHALMREPGKRATRSPAERRFCVACGSALWLWDPLAGTDPPARLGHRHAVAETAGGRRGRPRLRPCMGRRAEGKGPPP